MNKWARTSFYQAPEGDAPAGGAPAPAPAPGPASSSAPSPAPGPSPAPAPADPTAGYWPGDWRDKVAAGDQKEQERLARFASPADLYKQNRELEKKLSSGGLKPVLAKDATPEDVAAYRKAHGIPEAADKYDLSDVKVPEHDKEFMDGILKAAHDAHQTPAQIKPVIKAFFDLAAKSKEKMAELDSQVGKAAEDELRNEWGQDYRRHTNLINGLMDLTGDPKLNEALMNGRLADGTLVKHSVPMQKFLLQLALINNPAGVVVPSHNGNPMQGLDDEIGKIEKTMRTDRKTYDRDTKMQERLRELYGAREKLKARA